ALPPSLPPSLPLSLFGRIDLLRVVN
ncbi:cation-transporting atpase 13a3, partial [Nannochloropsis oceanica]